MCAAPQSPGTIAAAAPSPPGAAPARGARRRLIAPTSACPDQTDARRARRRAGAGDALHDQLRPRHAAACGRSATPPTLDRAARRKCGDILALRRVQPRSLRPRVHLLDASASATSAPLLAAGENIAWGTGALGSVRSIFNAWLHSPGHRANILGSYAQIGIGLRVGSLEGHAGAHVWTQEFGSTDRRCLTASGASRLSGP